MNCQEMQVRISTSVDLELGSVEENELRAHLHSCAYCSAVYEDLRAIRETSKILEPASPPDSVWRSLRLQLQAEGLIERPQKASFWERLFPVGFVSGLKPALTGAIVTLALIGTSYFLATKHFNRGPETTISTDALALVEIQKAELHYQQAIEALSEMSQKRLQALDPRMAQIFNDNLATMDYYLSQCKEVARTNSDNPLVHRYLLTAYQKKVELLETIVNSDSL
jgi:hypothetical protein